MCYYFAVTLRDSILFGLDRTFNNKLTGENRMDVKRYSVLPNNRIFLPTGHMWFCTVIQSALQSILEDSLELFEIGKSELSELFSKGWEEVKKDAIDQFRAAGKKEDVGNIDCLYSGFDQGNPFIISVSSVDDFQLKLVDKPNRYICLNQTPEVLTFVRNSLHSFLGATQGQEADKTWELAKRFLPGIISKISKADRLVSANGDLIFLTKDKVLTHEF